MPWKRGHSPLKWVPEYEDYLFEQWTHGTFSDYWRQLGLYAEGFYDQFADVPMVHISTSYDHYPRTATDNYKGLTHRKKGPVSLILGPWTHGNRSITYAGDVDFGAAATLDENLAEDYLAPSSEVVRPMVERHQERGGRRACRSNLCHGRRHRQAKQGGSPRARRPLA